MDFVTGFCRTRSGFDSIWVIVDWFTKVAVFIPIKATWPSQRLANLYMSKVVSRYGVPTEIISDIDGRFQSHLWAGIQYALGNEIQMSTSFHPETDGQSERTIQTLEDMLRACALECEGSWDSWLPLAEFAYNNSYHSAIKMAPFEALYGQKCRTPWCWGDLADKTTLGWRTVKESREHIRVIHDRLRAAQDRQKKYADRRRRDYTFQADQYVFLKVTPMRGVKRFGKRGKLNPRYIGPYRIIQRVGEVAYKLELPPSLGRTHNVFHISQLRQYVPNPNHQIDPETVEFDDGLRYEESPLQILQKETRSFETEETFVKVLWANQDEKEATWEREEAMREAYPELFD